MGKIHWNTYHGPKELDGHLSPHKERDGAAFAHLMALLVKQKGLEFGKLLLNYPASYQITEHALNLLRSEGVSVEILEKIRKLTGKPLLHKTEFSKEVSRAIGMQKAYKRDIDSILKAALIEVSIDTSFLGPDDYLVQTTRPFLRDHIQEGHKAGERSNTSLEIKVFEFLEQFFETLSRAQVCLSASMAAELEKAARLRSDDSDYKADIKFLIHNSNENACGSYSEFKRHGALKWSQPNVDEKKASIYKTAVYLIHAENVLDHGAGLIVAFGMNGLATLAWTYLLQTGKDSSGRELSTLIDRPAFVMAEMTMGAEPPRPSDLSFIDDWKVEILLEHPIASVASKQKPISNSPS